MFSLNFDEFCDNYRPQTGWVQCDTPGLSEKLAKLTRPNSIFLLRHFERKHLIMMVLLHGNFVVVVVAKRVAFEFHSLFPQFLTLSLKLQSSCA